MPPYDHFISLFYFIDVFMFRLYNVRILFLDTHMFIKLFLWYPYFAPTFRKQNTLLSLSHRDFVLLCFLLLSCVCSCVFQIWLPILVTELHQFTLNHCIAHFSKKEVQVLSSWLLLRVPLSTVFYVRSIKSIIFNIVFSHMIHLSLALR